jgi:hypothetical protein
MPEGRLPVLDPLELHRIGDETGVSAADEFAATYRRLLPQRIARIKKALSSGNAEDAMDAALSLKVSSAMNGALLMERICLDLVNALDAASYPSAQEACQRIEDHLPLLETAMGDRLPRMDAAA